MSRVDEINAILDGFDASATFDEVEYALRDYGQRELISVLADRAAAGGGAGEPFNGGTITEPLVIDLDGQVNIAGLVVLDHNGRPIVGASGAGLGEPTLLGDPTLHVDEHGVDVLLDGLSAGFSVADRSNNGLFGVSATGGVIITPSSGSTDNPLNVFTESGAGAFSVLPSGELSFGGVLRANAGVIIYKPSAPADGDISAQECALWYDSTNGAAKLMIKAKTADGTVVTGNVPLAP